RQHGRSPLQLGRQRPRLHAAADAAPDLIRSCREAELLQKTVLLLTWIWAITFLILESYVTLSWGGSLLESGYLVDVFGVGLMFWAIVSAPPVRHRPVCHGLGLDDRGFLARYEPPLRAAR